MASSSGFVDVVKPDPGALAMPPPPQAFALHGRHPSSEVPRHLVFLHSMPLVTRLNQQTFQPVQQLDTQGEVYRISSHELL